MESQGVRARNKRSRRQRLEDIALELFERDGFDGTTIEQITAAAGLSPRTFFSYFATKDDLLLADYGDRLERILAELAGRPAGETPWADLRASFATVAADYEAAADRLRRRFTIVAETPSVSARSLQLQAGWERALVARLRTRLGAPDDDPTPRLLAAAAVAIMRTSLEHWLSTPRPPALPVLVEQGFARFADGLR